MKPNIRVWEPLPIDLTLLFILLPKRFSIHSCSLEAYLAVLASSSGRIDPRKEDSKDLVANSEQLTQRLLGSRKRLQKRMEVLNGHRFLASWLLSLS
jgi:hypothetical protein